MATYYFILPVFNEKDGIRAVLDQIVTASLPAGYSREIIAVEDDSTDGTLAILEEFSKEHPVHILHLSPRRGIPRSFEAASKYLYAKLQSDDVVIIMESDGTSDISCIPKFAEEIQKGAGIVIASRHTHGGGYVNFPAVRVLGSSVVNRFLSLLWRVPGVRDYTIFFRAYRGDVFRKFEEEGGTFIAGKSFAANGELLYRLSKYTSHISEIPLTYDYGIKQGPSKMRLFQTLLEYMKLTMKFEHFKSHLQIIRFLISGCTAAVSNIASLFIMVHFFNAYYLYASMASYMIGMVVSFFLQKFWAFRDKAVRKLHVQFAAYLAVFLSNLVLNTVLMYTLVDKLGVWYVFAQLLAGVAVAIVGYFGYKKLVFTQAT